MTQDALFARAGLIPQERLLTRTMALVWSGSWEALAQCFTWARGHGASRLGLEEMLLQAVLFCGFPRVVTAFELLQARWPQANPPRGGGLPQDEQRPAGAALFAEIYGQNTKSVRDMLLGYHPELHDFVLETAYGRILTRPGIEARVRELMAVGTLVVMDQIPQLVAHGRGALHFGATREQLTEALFTTLEDLAQARQLVVKITRSRSKRPGS